MRYLEDLYDKCAADNIVDYSVVTDPIRIYAISYAAINASSTILLYRSITSFMLA